QPPLAQFSLSRLSKTHSQTLQGSVMQLQTEINISTGKTLVAAVYDSESPKLVLLIHHLVLDGISWRIILDDLQTVWQQLSHRQTAILPAKTTAFKDWAEQLQDYAQQPDYVQEIAYWRQQCEQAIRWPVAYLQASKKSYQRHCLSLSLTESHTLLRQLPGRFHCKIDALLLTALCQALGNWSGENYQRIDMEGHGREEGVLPITCHRTVGLFSSLFPMAFTLEQGTYQQQIKSINQQLQAPKHHGMGYGVLRYLHNDASLRQQLMPAAQAPIRFNFLGQYHDQSVADSLFSIQGSVPLYLDLNHQPLYSLELIGHVQQGQLHLQWVYNETVYSALLIEKLAEDMMTILAEIIHAKAASSAEDFPLAELDEDEFSRLQALLKQADHHE
ncbi:MAG: hypothetical protein KAJ63_02120, partial [Methyloprofundus sp.]|nr:hypothetical protein [Methyloprofundus sp.]